MQLTYITPNIHIRLYDEKGQALKYIVVKYLLEFGKDIYMTCAVYICRTKFCFIFKFLKIILISRIDYIFTTDSNFALIY